MNRSVLHSFAIVMMAILLTHPLLSQAEDMTGKKFPYQQLSNGLIDLKCYTPDPTNGFYQGTRFDWAGIVTELTYDGHSYFGPWKDTHNPKSHDDLTGPVEDFRTGGDGLGYKEAKPGDTFVKIGIGRLRRGDEKNFLWIGTYPIVDVGERSLRKETNSLAFEHTLPLADDGYAYHYIKTIELVKNEPVMQINHRLQNTGEKNIDTVVYNHNFFQIDGASIGPAYQIDFPFPVVTGNAERGLEGRVTVHDDAITFSKQITGSDLFTDLIGFEANKANHRFRIRNTQTGAGASVSGDRPVVTYHFWATERTVCPEPYVHMLIKPGDSCEWTLTYRFFSG